MTDEDRTALAEIVRAARAELAALPPGPLSVACPQCGSGVGAFCRTTDGIRRVTAIHAPRRTALGQVPA
jgi:hypothetical protein